MQLLDNTNHFILFTKTISDTTTNMIIYTLNWNSKNIFRKWDSSQYTDLNVIICTFIYIETLFILSLWISLIKQNKYPIAYDWVIGYGDAFSNKQYNNIIYFVVLASGSSLRRVYLHRRNKDYRHLINITLCCIEQ